MKIYALLEPDYDGDRIIGLFSTKEKAEAARDKGYYNPDSFEITEYDTDQEVGNKFEPFYEHTINSIRDYGVRPSLRSHDSDAEYVPNEHVWNVAPQGLQAHGLGKTPEEATRRAHELLAEFASLPPSDSSQPAVTIPRPELIVRSQYAVRASR